MSIGKILIILGVILGLIATILAFATFVPNDLNNLIFLPSFIMVVAMFTVYVGNLLIVFVAKNKLVVVMSALISAILTLVVIPYTFGLIISILLLIGGFLVVRKRFLF